MIRNKLMQTLASALLVLCLGVSSQAQTINEQLDFLFAPLNKSRITTGMLLERGLFPHSPIPFNGTLTDSSYTSPLLQRSLYVGLHSSVISSAVSMASPEEFYGNLSAASTSGVVLSMLHYNMNRIKENALTSGLLSYHNGQLHDVPGSATPYQPFTLFAVAPVNAEAWGTTVTFTLNSLLRMTNSTAPISQLQIDPGDGGGYRTIAFNTPLTLTYTTAGQKVVRVALTPSGGQTLRSHFRLTVHPTAQPLKPSPYDYSDDAIPFEPVTGVHSGGVAFVKYSTSNSAKTLRKPLIVAEGIDPSSVLSFILNYSINNFYWATYNVFLDGGDRFWNALISEYDIVFLDYTNGVDDIFRNARLLEQVIEWANAQKANVPDAQPNVVLGVSMGGLVSRVALRRMEVEGKSHDTRLYISLDSPHKGANVPPAYQALAWHMNSYLSFVDPSLSRFLYAPATKQMLKYCPDPVNNTFISTHHNTFMTQYDALGFPATTRNVAIANGSNAGTSQFGPYATMINAVHNVDKYKFTVKGYAMPNKQSRVVYEAKVEWDVSGWFWDYLGVNKTKVELKKYISNSSHLPYDGAPGGYYPLSWVGGLPDEFDSYVNYSNFSFIPITSALGVNSSNPFEIIANQNLIGAGRTSFVTYFTQASNQSHTQLTPQNARFILNELAGTNLCVPISGITISGSTTVCNTNTTFALNNLPAGSTVSWEHSSNLTYVSGQGTGTYRVKAASSTTSGPGWVQAVVSGPCGDLPPLRRSVSVGPPARPHIRSGSSTQTGGSASYTLSLGEVTTSLQLFFEDPPGTASATGWEVVKTGSPQNFDLAQSGNTVLVTPLQVGTGQFTVRSYNACGESTLARVYLTIERLGGGIIDPPGWPIELSPNPARGEVLVTLGGEELRAATANGTLSAAGDAPVVVTSATGQPVYRGQLSDGTLRLNVSGWQRGVYQVVVVHQGQRHAASLVVE